MSATETGLTPSERYVSSLCERSFLQLWTHPNPQGKKGKELCDCLVVCGPHIVIISVKDNEYRETEDETGWERWTRAAVDKSIRQIVGAERWLEQSNEVKRSDGRIISLPRLGHRRYHRVAVALGAHGQVPIRWGDAGTGFVHVCDEYSVGALFLALDTIVDFVGFLSATEELVRNGVAPLMDGGGIEDLVALYILNGHSYQLEESIQCPDLLIVQNDLWSGLVESEEFKSLRREMKDSYIWDRLIEHFAKDLLSGGMFDMHSRDVTDNELALVTMASQPRAARNVLGRSLKEYLENEKLKSAARVVSGHDGTAFVFMIGSSMDRDYRSKELALRCLVVRGRFPKVHTVVGIATDRPGSSSIGYSSDIVYVHLPEWTEKSESDVKGIQEDLGYFKNVSWGDVKAP